MHQHVRSAVLLLAGLSLTAVLPTEQAERDLHRLFSRGQNWDASCDRTADAGTFAQVTQSGTDSAGNAFTESTAFSHYFGDGDKETVKNMMQAIYDDRIPDNSNHSGEGYTITVKCGDDQDDECGPSVLAVTSPKPDETRTKQDLTSKQLGPKRGQWCQPNEQFPFFEVAGLTVFHEMTHLHLIGKKAGSSAHPDPDGFDSAGTVDPWQAARELHRLWDVYNGDNNEYKPTTPTTENVESYAAAALEFYFLGGCMWDVILPE
ncbi:hypothetical protein GGR57DRAFT_492376 [Xylariaceae sp. FL1272]|nr:hypothetical protein GGR57DRAFT_492376 [Xylariaceae sp. FL1272]